MSNDPIVTNVAACGLMLQIAADLSDTPGDVGAFDDLFRSVLAAAHALNIIGPALIERGRQMGLSDEHFDGLALDVATEGMADNLNPDDFA